MTTRRFDKVLVANRGEIAVRVIRGVQEAGLKAVAVYSDIDRDAMHVRCADEAVYIGGNAPSESYLNIPKLIDACRRTGAGAVHPGYGFLSEKEAFAAALAEAKLILLGPPASAMEAMGLKTRARDLMRAAGVPIVPGTDGPVSDPNQALVFAHQIGFPVLIKATAGGGGKGMRTVYDPETFIADFSACEREATNAFGDGRVFVEKFIVKPRHVEFQILADEHGNVRHLFERDCSIQRRHQKVIEETPCPVLRDEVRQAMGAVAVRAAAAVGYVGAGTVEFLIDADQNFYFLEMNTRLQVEHPITEMITGIDLVAAQISIAQGHPIPWSQESLTRRGHSIECRVYAEDPEQNFLPSPGPIHILRSPAGPFVRNDAGYESGDAVPMFYDPLVSKLVVWGEDRAQAVARMKRALRDYVIAGIRHNIPFHLAVLDDPDFLSGHYDTSFIATHRAEGGVHFLAQHSDEEKTLATIAAALHLHLSANKPASAGAAAPAASSDASPWRLTSRLKRLHLT
jgi:acetyl-CoA carboxylase biotin carboxylase subunit